MESTKTPLNEAQKHSVSVTMVLADQALSLCERLLRQGGEQGLLDTITEERLAQRSWLWGLVALLALLGLLASLLSQQPDNSWGISGVRLMPRLPEPVVYALMGLFALGA